MKVNIFHHVADVPHANVIFNQQIDRILDSKILDRESKYHICINGNIDNFQSSLNKISHKENVSIVQVSSDCKRWEYPTLCYLKQVIDSSDEKSHVCYIHVKGARQPHNQRITDWRKLMEYFIIDKHDTCINEINNGYDIVGINWINGSINKHFSGNFWWADSDYIKKLTLPPNPDTILVGDISPITGLRYDYHNWRYDHEGWISTADHKSKEIYNSVVDHYQNSYPENLYRS